MTDTPETAAKKPPSQKKAEKAMKVPSTTLRVLTDAQGKKIVDRIFKYYMGDENYSKFVSFMLAVDQLIVDYGGRPTDGEFEEDDQDDDELDLNDDEEYYEEEEASFDPMEQAIEIASLNISKRYKVHD